QLTGMADSIGIARGTLLYRPANLTTICLFLRHTDAWAVLSFSPRQPDPRSQIEMRRTHSRVHGDELEFDLTRERFVLSAGPGDSLLLMDLSGGALFRVDPTGAATLINLLIGLPKELSAPLVLDDPNTQANDLATPLLIFAADSEPIEADASDLPSRRLPRTTYPALLTIAGKQITAIGRQDLRAPGGFPAYALRIRQLVPAPDGSFVAYDQASGQIVRITLIKD
ncbi:MAG TPA: hypothetical protein VNL70_11050, partial [Tepidisphaeraceae bacterium]|nr:hypothetical protein [Tepidisphaeraceae bacterium]